MDNSSEKKSSKQIFCVSASRLLLIRSGYGGNISCGKCFAARDILHHPAKNWNENFHARHNGAMRVFGDRALARSAKISSILRCCRHASRATRLKRLRFESSRAPIFDKFASSRYYMQRI